MRQFLVLVLIVASATPAFADRAAQNAARQRAVAAERDYNIRMAAARKEAAIRQAAREVEAKKAAAARREAAKHALASQRSVKPSATKTTGTGQTKTQVSNQDAAKVAVGALLLGALILSMSDSDGGYDSASTDADREAAERSTRSRHAREYWEDRARQDAAAGNHDAAASSQRYSQSFGQ